MCPPPWPQGLAFEQAIDAFWLHPFGDLCKSVETGSQSSLQLVYVALTAGNRIKRWAIRFLPLLEKVFRKHKRPVGGSWRMDETCIKVRGAWKYLYRAVDKEGRAVDFLLAARRDKAAAMRFFDKAMQANSVPEKITMDKSGASKAAMDEINVSIEIPIIERPSQIPEQHRGTRPSRSQTGHQLETQLQVISSRQMCAGWYRIDAHDSQRSTHAGRLHRAVFC